MPLLYVSILNKKIYIYSREVFNFRGLNASIFMIFVLTGLKFQEEVIFMHQKRPK